MTPSEINARIQPFTAREIGRYLFRVGLFTRRGRTVEVAEAMADRLALRDQERDDRRICLECSNLTKPQRAWDSWGCFAAQQGWIPGGKGMRPLLDTLQRCEQFEWQKP